MDNKEIITVRSFTDFPGARHKSDGDGSAEEFFEAYVKPVLDRCQKKQENILLDFDNTYGYASSFVSELAMRIATTYDKEYIKNHLSVKSNDETNLIDRFWVEYEKKYSN